MLFSTKYYQIGECSVAILIRGIWTNHYFLLFAIDDNRKLLIHTF